MKSHNRKAGYWNMAYFGILLNLYKLQIIYAIEIFRKRVIHTYFLPTKSLANHSFYSLSENITELYNIKCLCSITFSTAAMYMQSTEKLLKSRKNRENRWIQVNLCGCREFFWEIYISFDSYKAFKLNMSIRNDKKKMRFHPCSLGFLTCGTKCCNSRPIPIKARLVHS